MMSLREDNRYGISIAKAPIIDVILLFLQVNGPYVCLHYLEL